MHLKRLARGEVTVGTELLGGFSVQENRVASGFTACAPPFVLGDVTAARAAR
jgi:hypothetical protein